MNAQKARSGPSGPLVFFNGLTVEHDGGNFILRSGDANNYLRVSSAAPTEVLIPNDSVFNFPVNTIIILMQGGSGSVTITADGGVVINYPASLTLTIAEQYAQVYLRKVAANTWDACGGLGG